MVAADAGMTEMDTIIAIPNMTAIVPMAMVAVIIAAGDKRIHRSPIKRTATS